MSLATFITPVMPRRRNVARRPRQLAACATDPLHSTPTVVVGGGPAGLLSAAMLSAQGWTDITVIERVRGGSRGDPGKSFSYNISWRGLRALNAVPGLLEEVSRHGVETNPAVVAVCPARKKAFWRTMAFNAEKRNIYPFWMRRASMVGLLGEWVARLDGVRVLDGLEVVGMAFGSDRVEVRTRRESGEEEIYNARLVLGCDGSRSIVRKTLVEDGGKEVESVRGFELDAWESPATDLIYKTVELAEEPRVEIVPELAPEGEDVERTGSGSAVVKVGSGTMLVLKGDEESRAEEDVFSLGLLPVGVDLSGGRTSTITGKKGKRILEVATVEEGYKLLRENFPQVLHVDKLVSQEAMARFVNVKAGKFPKIQRSRSLAGKMRSGGAVVLLGDSAHAFPPDLGQGVNAAFEDVLLFTNALRDAATAGEGLSGAVERFERGRDKDVSALMRLMVIGAPYQYQQSSLGPKLWMANQVFRMTLSKVAPALFAPQIFSCIGKEDMSYSEVLSAVNATTRRIWALVVTLLVVVAIVAISVQGS